MIQLGAQDSQFIYMENDNNLSNVVLANIYAPPKKNSHGSIFDMVKARVAARLHVNPIFTRKLVRVPLDLDYPYWAEDEFFDLDGHFYLHQSPAPSDWQQLADVMGKVHSRPLDMKRPVWEMHVVENLSGISHLPEGSFAVLVKMHHCAVDGAAMVNFFTCLSDIDAKGTPATDISILGQKAGVAPTSEQMWKRCLVNNIQAPGRLAKTLVDAAPLVVPGLLKSLTTPDAKEEKVTVPQTRLDQDVSPWKIFDAVDFDLADFKLISKSVPEAKINDVLLAVCSGGLRHYLEGHNSLPNDSLVAWVPINTRPADADDAGGNQITAMAAKLCTHVAEPLARLKAITVETQMSKAAKAGVSARLMTDVTKGMPGATLPSVCKAMTTSGMLGKLCNVAISNVPGSQVPIYMDGAECLHQYGMTPLNVGMGLFFVACSYNGKLSVTITSTKEVLPDMAVLKDCLEQAVNELKQAALELSGGSTAKKPAPKRRAAKSKSVNKS